ncbi:MAG TPA: response regulator [Steroidobacteraceae bacterium]|nr:response regulator [Steroidobacteraceae bacterium]
MRLLLVEDDAMIGRAVAQALRAEHYALDWVRDGEEAEAALAAGVYDLMLLDLSLPKRDGLEVLSRLRRRGLELPVLIMTARDAVENRVAGLDAGADDYLPKPFDLDELSARIRALLRRRHGHAEPLLKHRGVSLNPATREVLRDGAPVALTGREYALLQALLERPSALLAREQILDKLYGWGEEVESNTLDVYIHSLRRKLGAEFIVTVRGVGYSLAPADAQQR